MLIRSWNLFHGNTSPPGHGWHLAEMVRLASADRPDVLLLQEIPAWALDRLDDWSGMAAVGDVAQRAVFGPVPISTELGRKLTSLDPSRLRSAFSGQGNAILLAAGTEVVAHEVCTLNPRAFRREQARVLGLGLVARLAWAKERRICQAVRLTRGPTENHYHSQSRAESHYHSASLLVANLHATSSPGDERIPAAEVRRAAAFVGGLAREGDTVVLGGDFNVHGAAAVQDGYSAPGPGIDHILIRGATPSPLRVWPGERRTRHGMLLSDHAPIELEI